MNRIKILLTAVGVLAFVGSALAYSGRFTQTICYVTKSGTCSSTTSCTTRDTSASVNTGGTAHCYQIVDDGASCDGVKCPHTGTVSNTD